VARLKEVIFERLYEKGIRSFEPASIFEGSAGNLFKKNIYNFTESRSEMALCNLAKHMGGELVFRYEGKDYPIDGVKQYDVPLEEMYRDLDAWLVGKIKEE
jgi:hypothetical protein